MRHATQIHPLGRLAAGVAALFLIVAPAPAQIHSEVTDVVVVEVPVQVVRDGAPVRGLSAADFEVYEGRKKQTVTGFEVIDLAAATAAIPAAGRPAAITAITALPASARRHFLMLFDLAFSEPRSVVLARDAARGVLGKLHASDLVAVATYSNKGPQIVLGFTSDKAQVESAIDTLGVPQLVDRNPDPLKLVAAEVRATEAAKGDRAGITEALLAHFESMARESQRAQAAVQKAQVAALTRSFADLAKLMNSVEGRKHVVYLSEGFDSSILTGTVDQAEQDRMNEAAAAGEIWNVDSDARYGSGQATNDLEQMLEEFRRADCVIQAVDIGGLRAGGDLGSRRASGADALTAMAKDTGGELYRNFNDLGAAMGQMLERTGVTYLLAFQPENVKRDSSYHRIRVELKNAPRGTRVVHRPGYYAPKPFAQQSGTERLLAAANQLLSDDPGSVPTAVLAAPFRQAGQEKSYVPVLIEAGGPSLLAGKQGASVPAEIFVYAMDASGAVHDFVTQTMSLDLAKTEATLRQTGLKFFGHVDLLPGDYSLRVLVRNGATGVFGLRVAPLTVPAAAQAGPVLLPPLFPEPSGKWVLVPEAPRGGKRPEYPFLLDQQPFVPASKPVLGPGQEARLALIGYNLGQGDLQATARITSADGREVEPGVIALGAREPGASGAPDRLAATFRAPQLAPGEYRLSVQLTGPGGTATTSAAPFVIGAPAPALSSK
jgi:VWFA-related protein